MKRKLALFLSAVLLAGSLSSCSVIKPAKRFLESNLTKKESSQSNGGSETEESIANKVQTFFKRKTAFAGGASNTDSYAEVVPSVAPYTVNADLSNIDNLWQYTEVGYMNGMNELLARNGFGVSYYGRNEFFEVYESNRYEQKASFVTVDSLMHTYHLYFSYLMKNIERDYLSDNLTQMSRRMYDGCTYIYDKMKGSPWEDAARRNLIFFTVGLKLLDDNVQVQPDVEDAVNYELSSIFSASGMQTSSVTDSLEDYTQYTPRGYYEGDERLERYFRAMMWYGRIHFKQTEEPLNRCALLISMMMDQDAEGYALWQSIYDVTAFFAGASDDAGIDEYRPILHDIYGDSVTTDTLLADPDAFDRFQQETALIAPSRVTTSADGNGFRFMGQRFTIDALIMQNLIYDNVGANSSGDNRMFPDVLDVPAALGSDVALDLLTESGQTDYSGYLENMEELRQTLYEENEDIWTVSLYAGWLDTLRPLLQEKGEGYPMFMQNREWTKKDLECFAGSYTELKHDTVLYSKQVIAEMGGGGMEQVPDDRGYVEPEPLVYSRFSSLASRTAEGLRTYGLLSLEADQDLARLGQMADMMLEISVKELRDELLTDEEFEFIRSYGGSLEHFWIETLDQGEDVGYISTQEAPAALVVDVATDPLSGQVLELANDTPSTIYVAVKVDGKVKIATGSVYKFYQFPWPMSDRLTDSRWCQMLGIQQDESGNYNSYRDSFVQPQWTDSYRTQNVY